MTLCRDVSSRAPRRCQSLFSWMLLCDNLITDGIVIGYEFQSLFSWMLLCDSSSQDRLRVSNGFQSLFSWMLLCDLCCIRGICYEIQRFQSLFSWMLLCDNMVKKTRPTIIMSFNPCFRGCCSVTMGYSNEWVSFLEFQSLFSWMLLCDVKQGTPL